MRDCKSFKYKFATRGVGDLPNHLKFVVFVFNWLCVFICGWFGAKHGHCNRKKFKESSDIKCTFQLNLVKKP